MSTPFKLVKLSSIADVDQASLSSKTPADFEFEYVSLSDVDNGRISGSLPRYRFLNAPSRARKRIKYGDVLMSTVRPNLEGHAVVDIRNTDNVVVSTGFAVISAKEKKAHGEFIYQYLFSHHIRKQIHTLLVGSNYPAINSRDVKNLKIAIPSIDEQIRVSVILNTWDAAIEKTQKLIEAKKKSKWIKVQRLITRKRADTPLSTFLNPVTRTEKKPAESYTALGIRSHFKGTFHREVKNPDTVSMDILYKVRENDLIVNITFAWEGAIALVKKDDEHCYVSHRFPTYKIKPEKAVPSFIGQIIQTERMKYNLANISPGGAGRNRVLNKKDFLKLKIWLPDLENQTKVGSLLGAIDKEIELLELLVGKYKAQKRGLMQKLLTGEWRIKSLTIDQ